MVLSATPMVDSVFFDLGFTLINFEGDFHGVLKESYIALADSLINSGCQFDTVIFTTRFNEVFLEYYRARESDLIEQPVEGYLKQVLQEFNCSDLPDQVIADSLTAMYEETESHWQVEEDAYPTLDSLHQQGYRLGLITNAANAANSNRLIDKFALRRYFDVILISAEEKIRKPDTRIYSRALTRMGTSPGRAVMVGDTLTADILGAQNSGMKGVWITRRAKRPENDLDHIKPDRVISTLSQLLTVIPQIQ